MLFCAFRFAFKAGQNGHRRGVGHAVQKGQQQVEHKPARPHRDMRPRKRRLKKLRPLIQTSATTKAGKKPIMAQLLVIPSAEGEGGAQQPGFAFVQRGTPAGSGPRRRRAADRAFHSRSPKAAAAEAAAVACSQKVSCRPQTSAARTGGSQAAGIERKPDLLGSCWRCSWVRSCGSNATERANKARVRAAQTAANKLRASGISLGRQPAERVGHQPKSGPYNSGCQVQPDTLATC